MGKEAGKQASGPDAAFAGLTDEQLVERAAADDKAMEFLMRKYKNFVRSRARSYFLVGADQEDIVQEGMIGLYKAIRDYRGGKNASFRGFAELCITRQIITAVKTATRQKHRPLNSYISLNRPVSGGGESGRTLADTLDGARVTDPEEIIIGREDDLAIGEEIAKVLSKLERIVINYYLEGKSYVEIAKIMGRGEKSIDNALQRAKAKIERYFQQR